MADFRETYFTGLRSLAEMPPKSFTLQVADGINAFFDAYFVKDGPGGTRFRRVVGMIKNPKMWDGGPEHIGQIVLDLIFPGIKSTPTEEMAWDIESLRYTWNNSWWRDELEQEFSSAYSEDVVAAARFIVSRSTGAEKNPLMIGPLAYLEQFEIQPGRIGGKDGVTVLEPVLGWLGKVAGIRHLLANTGERWDDNELRNQLKKHFHAHAVRRSPYHIADLPWQEGCIR